MRSSMWFWTRRMRLAAPSYERTCCPNLSAPRPERLLSDHINLLVAGEQTGTGEQVERTIDQAEEIHNDLWSRAVDIAAQQPTPISALFVQSLNDVFDLHETRITVGINYRLPGIVWLTLYGLAVLGLGLGLGGYEIGLTSNRKLISAGFLTAVAFSVVILLEISLDRPHQQLASIIHLATIDTHANIQCSMQSQP